MAFNFFGTFTTGQWEYFKAFSQIQVKELRLRKRWLEKERLKIGVFVTEYDGPRPVSFVVSAKSYAAKLLEAYRILGGFPEKDMLLRTRDQPVYKSSGPAISISNDGTVVGGFSDVYTDGRRERGNQRYDRDLGLKVEKFKQWQLESIKFKRERIEFKIKRALDYSDELQKEIDFIDKLLGEGRGSFDERATSIESRMIAPGTANVIQNLDDLFGLNIGRPGDITLDNAIKDANINKERLPK
jgi:hypothetical protein